MKTLTLFRNNLRKNDNPALFFSSVSNEIIPVYIYDDINIRKELGGASKYWLYHSLKSLDTSLEHTMHYFKGNTIKILERLVAENDIKEINYEEPFLEDDIILHKKIVLAMHNKGVEVKTYNCTVLWKPYEILKNDGSPYKVFSPYYRKGCLKLKNPSKPLGQPNNLNFIKIEETSIDVLNLIDKTPWHKKFENHWDISEKAALKIFNEFIENSIYEYKIGRDFPAINKNSRLSPYIRFGLISVNRIWYMLENLDFDKNVEHYKSEIGWREFSYYLLYHFPFMAKDNLQKKFDNFNWDNNEQNFDAWKKGETGFPIVDAGMKELWQTGYMHNRIRMVVASFLVKNLLIDWRLGEAWFWDCLFDADYASNIAGWQWTAGTGADAAPYFRIFNPILQGQKFDSEGKYTTKYIPELSSVPIKNLQEPSEFLDKLNYPKPIIDYKLSRNRSLKKYEEIK